MTTTSVQPVVREIDVNAPIATCFRVFVDDVDTWWPPEHHIGERDVERFVFEPFVGGRCYDVDTAGGESHWGTVLAIEPPDRFVFAWHVQGDWTCDTAPERQSEVEVTFTALDATSTHVRLEHRRLERHGDTAEGLVTGVSSPGGWTGMLRRFADVTEGWPPAPLPSAS